MNGWTVYILQCADGTLYTGITNDLKKRLTAHNNGTGAKYTRGRGPVKLLYKETRRTKSAALKREAVIKCLSRIEKIQLAGGRKTKLMNPDLNERRIIFL